MSDTLALASGFVAAHPDDAAKLLAEFSEEQNAAFLAALEVAPAAVLLAALPASQGAACLQLISAEDAIARLALTPPRVAADVLRNLSSQKRDSLLAGMSRTRQFQIGLVLRQPVQTVGAWMDSRVISVGADDTVTSVRRMLARDSRLPSLLFVVDGDRRPVGSVAVSAVLSASDDTRIHGLYTAGGPSLRANAGLAAASADPGWQLHDELPVVDHEGRLVGAIRYAALRQALAESQTADRAPGPRSTGSLMDIADLCYIGMARAIDASIARRHFDPPARKEDTR